MNASIIQDDGKILAGGTLRKVNFLFGVARFNKDGSLDSTFGKQGIFSDGIGTVKDAKLYAMTLQPDGKVILCGSEVSNWDFAMMRLDKNGSIDNGFGINGKVTTGFGNSSIDESVGVMIQSDGKILLGGFSTGGPALARYHSGLNLGVLRLNDNRTFSVYPNPAEQTVQLVFSLEGKQEVTMNLLDAEGRIVYSIADKAILEAGDHEQLILFPSFLPAGVYFISVEYPDRRETVKVIKI